MLQRVQKILSQAGIASRRKAEELILQGRVRVNGKVAVIGQQADEAKDVIAVDGKKIGLERKRYILLYKPSGYVTTTADKFAKHKVTDLLSIPEKVYHVGRLDIDAEGLLIMTNDGDFANRLMHPRYEVEKTYLVRLREKLRDGDIEAIKRGVFIDRRRVAASIRMIQKDIAEVTIHEGRHKIVKRIFGSLDNYVLRITRTGIGFLEAGRLKPGMWRDLTAEEVSILASGAKRSVDIVVRKGNEILLGRVAPKWSGGGKYEWGLPGREVARVDKPAVAQQLWDETGMALQSYAAFCTNDVEALGSRFIVTGVIAHATGVPKVTKPEDWQSWQWFPVDKLPAKLFPSAEKTLLSFLRKESGKDAASDFHRDSIDDL